MKSLRGQFSWNPLKHSSTWIAFSQLFHVEKDLTFSFPWHLLSLSFLQVYYSEPIERADGLVENGDKWWYRIHFVTWNLLCLLLTVSVPKCWFGAFCGGSVQKWGIERYSNGYPCSSQPLVCSGCCITGAECWKAESTGAALLVHVYIYRHTHTIYICVHIIPPSLLTQWQTAQS